jgi:hypothetical protein
MKNIKSITIIMFMAVSLSGCVSAPPLKSIPTQNAVGNQSRITIARSTDFLYLALDARVSVNGKVVAALPRGGSTYTDITPGAVTISVDHPTSPGTFTISFVTKPRGTYSVRVAPRDKSFGVGAMFGVVGLALESSPDNGGLFMVDLVDINEDRVVQNDVINNPVTRINKDKNKVRDQLESLKKLYDDGLIGSDLYKEQQKSIVSQ